MEGKITMMIYYLYYIQQGGEQLYYQPVHYQKPYKRKSAALATAKRLAHLRKLEFFAVVEIPDGEIPPRTIPDDDERLKHIFQDVYTYRDIGIKRHVLTPLTVKITTETEKKTTIAPPEGIEILTDPATGRTSEASWHSEQLLEKGKGWGADCPDRSGERLWLLDLIGKVKAEPNYALLHYTALEEIYRDFYGDYAE